MVVSEHVVRELVERFNAVSRRVNKEKKRREKKALLIASPQMPRSLSRPRAPAEPTREPRRLRSARRLCSSAPTP